MKRIFFINAFVLCAIVTNAQNTQIDKWLIKVDSLIQLKQYQPALRYLDSILLQDLDNVKAYERGLFIYATIEDYPTAFTVSKNLVGLEPSNAKYNSDAGWFGLLSGAFKEARPYLHKALELDEDNYSNYLNLGHLYNCLGDEKRCQYYYQYAVEYLPNEARLQAGPLDDLKLLKERKLLRFDTATVARLFRQFFSVYSQNHRSASILDSIYSLEQTEGYKRTSPQILQLKRRFCEVESEYKYWRYSVLTNFYWDIGAAQYLNRNQNKAIDFYLKKSMDLASSSNDTLWMINKLLASSRLDEKPSFYLIELALNFSKLTKEKAWEFEAYMAFADGYADLYNWDSSRYYASKAYQFANTFSDDDAADLQNGVAGVKTAALNRLANAFSALHQCDSALFYNSKYAQNLGSYNYDNKVWLSAEEDMATTLYKCGKYNEAISLLQQDLTSFKMNRLDSSVALERIGLCYYQLKDLSRAANYLNGSLSAYKKYASENPGKKGLQLISDQCAVAIEYLKRIYCIQKDADALFKVAEESKQPIFYAQFGGTLYAPSPVTIQQVQKTLKNGEVAISYSGSGEIGQGYAIAITNKQVRLMVENLDDYKKACRDPAIQESIKDMQYIVDEVIKTTGRKAADEEVKATITIGVFSVQLNRSIGTYKNTRSTITAVKKVDTEQTVKRQKAWGNFLFQLYVAPFNDLLANASKVYIAADRLTGFIPFEALKNEEGKYLGELYDISYVPSYTILRLLQQSPEGTSNKILAVGNPDYSTFKGATMDGRAYDLSLLGYGNWNDLPGTKAELDAIKSAIDNTDVIESRNVNESAIIDLSETGKLKNYKYLHFALHGMSMLVDYRDNSVILTEPANTNNDGFLQFWEIARLNINARLVCLSACESAVGGISGENDTYNLPLAFMLAGAKSVIGTSWKIDDKATSLFMTEFYKKIIKEGLSPSEALYKTRLQFIRGEFNKEYTAPAYWAAFKYFGY
jgi:CHAT domain-containing protein/tetratricopeptide (TPR) repeat protein